MRISDWSSDVCSSVLIVGCALDDTITHWNKGAARLLGRTADEVVGACRLAEVLPDDATAAVERAGEALVGGDRAQHESGTASCWERVCRCEENSVEAGSLKKKHN